MRGEGIGRRGTLCVIVLAGAFALSAPAPLRAQGLSAADLEAQKALSSAFVKLVLARDWDALAAMYGEDAILCPPNQPAVKGRAAIKAWMATLPPVTEFKAADVRKKQKDGRRLYSVDMFNSDLAPGK